MTESKESPRLSHEAAARLEGCIERSTLHMVDIVLGGIYPPLPTFYDTHEELDLDTYSRHISRLVDNGVTGYVVMGSKGEAVHLSTNERAQVIKAARQAAGPHA